VNRHDKSTLPADWLEYFYSGNRKVMQECYTDFFDTVFQSVGRVIEGADQETVVHEVFFRLLSEEKMRRRFTGDSLGAWLSTVARNRAIDFWRKYHREENAEPDFMDSIEHPGSFGSIDRSEARITLERFHDEVLPLKLKPVFKARFIQGLSQREAAESLGVLRTTLAYQEHQVKRELRSFLKGTQER